MLKNTNLERGAARQVAGICLSVLLSACSGGADDSASSSATRLAATVTTSVATPAGYTVSNIVGSANLYCQGGKCLNNKGQVSLTLVPRDFSASTAVRYEPDTGVLTDLHASSGATFANRSYALAINDNGQVTGGMYVNGVVHAFISDGTVLQSLATQDSGTSVGEAINANGMISGWYRNGAFKSDGITITDLGVSAASTVSANSINTSGQVAGYWWNGSSYRAFLSNGGTAKDLGSLGGVGSQGTYAQFINSSGQVAGQSSVGSTNHAFRSDGVTMTDLGALGGANYYSYALGMNDSGTVVGYSTDGTHTRGFQSDGTAMIDLGSIGGTYDLSQAISINNLGQIVGMAMSSTTGAQHAFIKSPGDSQMIDLNLRLNNAPGVEIYRAFSISDTGYIVAYGNTGYVLLKPAAPTSPPTAATLSPISANDPVAVNTPVNVSLQFSDINTADTHTATWNWDNTGTSAGVVTEPNGTTPGAVSGTKTFTSAGVYDVTVSVSDSGGLTTQVSRQVVVYDPSAGFVTGGGWIMSPAGAYKADPMMGGRANFGFVSKYLKGATTPSGNTEFQFQAANLNFHSENYDWLVVGGARAQYKGTGTINGTGTYKFLLTAVDGDLIAKGTPDRFRIKIWHHDDASNTDIVDYDNQLSSSTDGSNLEGTVIGGGSISVKTK